MSALSSSITVDLPGEHLVRELRRVHDTLRNDLARLRVLGDQVMANATPASIRTEIAQLQTTSPLWQLQVNCLTYCRFTHQHHTGEDVALFPALRAFDPALESVVDRLEADHRLVSNILEQVEAGAERLTGDDTPVTRRQIRDALAALAQHLLAHLDYEEDAISPTLRQWQSWPGQPA
jgi:iron-sulfur cluster repair protein YtfE (RIC family)